MLLKFRVTVGPFQCTVQLTKSFRGPGVVKWNWRNLDDLQKGSQKKTKLHLLDKNDDGEQRNNDNDELKFLLLTDYQEKALGTRQKPRKLPCPGRPLPLFRKRKRRETNLLDGLVCLRK